VFFKYHFDGKGNLLLNWCEMLSYTIDVAWEDVAWEEIRFIRERASEFNRVVVVTNNQFGAPWAPNLFIDADIRVFCDSEEANAWVAT